MGEKLWSKIEKYNSPYYVKDDDFCIYAREYITRKGYKGGQTNSDILNFKKSPSKTGKKYRTKAIEKFRKDVEQLFIKTENIIKTIMAIPSSKAKSDPEYDHRFENLFEELKKSIPDLIIEWPIEVKQTVEASRRSEKRPSPEHIKQNYVWRGFNRKLIPKRLFVFDDVLISGSHFRATSDFLRENNYKGQIIGVFWARAKEDDKEWFEIIT